MQKFAVSIRLFIKIKLIYLNNIFDFMITIFFIFKMYLFNFFYKKHFKKLIITNINNDFLLKIFYIKQLLKIFYSINSH